MLCASANQTPRRQVGQKVLRQENKKLTPAGRAGSPSNDPQSASFPRAGHGICLGQVVFPSAATYLYLPLSPAEFSSHARTSRSHSLRWPRRLFLKTYKPFIFAQIHGVEATGPHAWTRFGSGKYGGNASALLGIKHDRHRNVAGGWWWLGPIHGAQPWVDWSGGIPRYPGPKPAWTGPPSTILNTPTYSIRPPPSTSPSAQWFSSIQYFARITTVQTEILFQSWCVPSSTITKFCDLVTMTISMLTSFSGTANHPLCGSTRKWTNTHTHLNQE